MKDKRSYSFDYGLVTRTKTAANMPSRALERTVDMMEDGREKWD